MTLYPVFTVPFLKIAREQSAGKGLGYLHSDELGGDHGLTWQGVPATRSWNNTARQTDPPTSQARKLPAWSWSVEDTLRSCSELGVVAHTFTAATLGRQRQAGL